MLRRCVICGCEHTEDENGNGNFHYPKSRKEAKIWQRSLNADNVPVEALQNYCCVCMEHIPEFVDHAATQSNYYNNFEQQMAMQHQKGAQSHTPKLDFSSAINLQNHFPPPPMDFKPPINVLLMTGASLPTYCGKSCMEEDNKLKKGKNDSDTDICVLESNFSDCGTVFPDIDEPEITMMRTPNVKKENEDKPDGKKKTNSPLLYEFEDDADNDEENTCAKNECTDVLLLCKPNSQDDCPCQCEKCNDQIEGPCCPPGCLPGPPPRYDDPPCGCECEQRLREELTVVVNSQAQRIKELEALLDHRIVMHEAIYTKVDELHHDLEMDPQKPSETKITKQPSEDVKSPTATDTKSLQAATTTEANPSTKESSSTARRNTIFEKQSEPKEISESKKKTEKQIEEEDLSEQNKIDKRDRKNNEKPKNNDETIDEVPKKKKPSIFKRIHCMMVKSPLKRESQTNMKFVVRGEDEETLRSWK